MFGEIRAVLSDLQSRIADLDRHLLVSREPHSSSPSVPDSSRPRLPKLKVSLFSGDNPLGWLFQIERFFHFQKTPMDQRITMASMYMTGMALGWFHRLHHSNQLSTWEKFKSALQAQFGPASFQSPAVSLIQLHQRSTVDAYAGSDRELVSLKPVNLSNAIQLVQSVEEKLQLSRFSYSQPLPNRLALPANSAIASSATVVQTSNPVISLVDVSLAGRCINSATIINTKCGNKESVILSSDTMLDETVNCYNNLFFAADEVFEQETPLLIDPKLRNSADSVNNLDAGTNCTTAKATTDLCISVESSKRMDKPLGEVIVPGLFIRSASHEANLNCTGSSGIEKLVTSRSTTVNLSAKIIGAINWSLLFSTSSEYVDISLLLQHEDMDAIGLLLGLMIAIFFILAVLDNRYTCKFWCWRFFVFDRG